LLLTTCKSDFGRGGALTLSGSSQRSPRPSSWIKRVLLLREGKGRSGAGKGERRGRGGKGGRREEGGRKREGKGGTKFLAWSSQNLGSTVIVFAGHRRSQEFVLDGALLLRGGALLTPEWPLKASPPQQGSDRKIDI